MSNRNNGFIYGATISFTLLYGIPWGLWLIAYALSPLQKLYEPLGFLPLFIWHVADRLISPFGELTFYAAILLAPVIVWIHNARWERNVKREQGLADPPSGFSAAWKVWGAIFSILMIAIPEAIQAAGHHDLGEALQLNLFIIVAIAGVMAVIPAFVVFCRNARKGLIVRG